MIRRVVIQRHGEVVIEVHTMQQCISQLQDVLFDGVATNSFYLYTHRIRKDLNRYVCAH